MDYNFITNSAICHQMILDTVPLTLVYYAHVPTAIISLLVGFFVFFKNPKALLNRLLLALSVTFSLWLAGSLISWVMNYNTALTMFSWSQLGVLNALFFALSLYFVYVFIDGKDVIFWKKALVISMLIFIAILSQTMKNLSGFTFMSCEAIEEKLFLDIILYYEIFISLWILILGIHRYAKAGEIQRRKIALLLSGIMIFLVSFFAASYYASYVDNFNYELYGLFGMTVFMGFLAYLIVKYKAFNIKLMAVQALVVSIAILIGSQFFFIRTFTNQILTGITLVLSSIGGYILVRSVKKEVEKSEELALANKEISERKEQLQRISDSLAISNEKLKQLDSAKTEFISMASHQLRTPVTGIKGYTSMLIEGGYGEVTPEQKGALKKAFESNERMSTLIEDLLNVSKIESGKLEYEFSKFKMEKICQEVVDTLFPKAKDHNLYLEYKAPKKALPELVIDGTKVREVISNLVDNAVKYTPKGGVTLSLELCARNEANCLSAPHIRITVSDTGIGVPPEEMEYLFLKFSRGKDVHRLNATGTGLGLFVGKKMIEGNGGKIWIESEGKDKGSRFIVELPVVREEEGLEGKG
ncbi:MAG: ATP-binding protein [Candidatus Moraniibacteriota bacterium]